MRFASLRSLSVVALSILAVLATSSVQAAITYNESFSYSDGALASPPPGVSGGLWVNHSGTGTFIPVSAGKITLSQGAGSREDVHRDFGTPLAAGQIVYAGFDISVTAVAPFTGTANDVYVGHTYVNSTTFPSRVFLTSIAGSDYTFGLGAGGTSPTATWPTGFAFGTTHRAVVSYNFDTGGSQLWIDAANQASTNISFTAASAQVLTAFAFRQGTPTTGSDQIIDNLIVASTFAEANVVPEPSTLILAGLGVIGLVGVARRRLRQVLSERYFLRRPSGRPSSIRCE